jgi:hypothetical protein
MARFAKRTETQMWSTSRSTMRRLMILIACETLGLPARTLAQPMEPHKVPTSTIHAQPAGDPYQALTPATDDLTARILKVQPPPKEGRDPSVPRFGGDQETVDSASKADARAVRTVPIGPDTDMRIDLDRHFTPRASAPSQPSPAAE